MLGTQVVQGGTGVNVHAATGSGLNTTGATGTTSTETRPTNVYVMWCICYATPAAGTSSLADLTDVNTATATNKFVLVADGVDFESRALVFDDLSDVDTTTVSPTLGDNLLWDGTNWVTNLTQLIKEVDFVGTTTVYQGEAAPGTETSTAAWRVKRTVFTGDDSETLFADGDSDFDNTWDGRAGFSYS